MDKERWIPRVLVVILNYLSYQLTLELIAQLKELKYPQIDVYVVDNASPNESGKVLESEAAKWGYTFYYNSNNSGYAAGNNIGIRYAVEHGYDYAWILNNDIQLTDMEILTHLVSEIENRESVACIGPKLYSLEGIPWGPYVNRPTFFSMTLGIFAEKKKREKQIHQSQEVYRLYGCCVLMRCKALQSVDYMDESTFLYCEEEILAERLLRKGFTSYYLAETSAVHMESVTVNRSLKARSFVKVKTVWKSFDIYLKEYRGYNWALRACCKFVRAAVMLIRG